MGRLPGWVGALLLLPPKRGGCRGAQVELWSAIRRAEDVDRATVVPGLPARGGAGAPTDG